MSFTTYYQQKLADGLNSDPAQLEVVHRFDALAKRLHQVGSGKRWIQIVTSYFGNRGPTAPLGLYVWGGVGRGKTLLMDLFFDWVPVEEKQRMHFHHFMRFVHSELADLEGEADPLQSVAATFREQALLLCFDEFFVSDIGDAMILAELLQALFNNGVFLVATSNTQPVELYENGLQRRRFLPAIELLERHTEVVQIGGNLDYRLEALHQSEIYRVSFPASDEQLKQDQLTLVRRELAEAEPIEVNDRNIHPRFNADGIAGFSFDELCATPRNAADYIELARLFHTIAIYDIPILTVECESAARRFIALVDEFYDRRVNVLFGAECPIHELYRGEQLTTPFERTISRVIEMQSDTYLSEAHRA